MLYLSPGVGRGERGECGAYGGEGGTAGEVPSGRLRGHRGEKLGKG